MTLTSQSYGISIGEETLDNLEKIYAINVTISTDLSEQALRVEAARLLMIEIVENPVDESMSGTLWLFPSAVCRLSYFLLEAEIIRAVY